MVPGLVRCPHCHWKLPVQSVPSYNRPRSTLSAPSPGQGGKSVAQFDFLDYQFPTGSLVPEYHHLSGWLIMTGGASGVPSSRTLHDLSLFSANLLDYFLF